MLRCVGSGMVRCCEDALVELAGLRLGNVVFGKVLLALVGYSYKGEQGLISLFTRLSDTTLVVTLY
jgi:hypothetical protein